MTQAAGAIATSPVDPTQAIEQGLLKPEVTEAAQQLQGLVGGVGTFAGLTDKATANIPVENGPTATKFAQVEAAVAAKADTPTQGSPISVTEGSPDFFNVAFALHINKPSILNHGDPCNAVFANAAGTPGLIPASYVYIRNTGSGTMTATGAIVAPAGYKLTAGPNEVFTADYDSVDDQWVSTTPASASLPANVPYTFANVSTANDVSPGAVGPVIVQSWVIPGNTIGASGKVTLDMLTSGSGTAGSRGWSMYLGPSGLTAGQLAGSATHVASYSQGSTLPFGHINIHFRNKNNAAQQVGVNGITGGGAATGNRVGTVDTTQAQTLYLALTKGAGADVANVDCGAIIITPGA